MTKIFYRDPDESAAQRELLDCIAGEAWGAIKAWQSQVEGRPQMTAIDVREAADEWLRQQHGHEVGDDEVSAGVGGVLAALDRTPAAIWL